MFTVTLYSVQFLKKTWSLSVDIVLLYAWFIKQGNGPYSSFQPSLCLLSNLKCHHLNYLLKLHLKKWATFHESSHPIKMLSLKGTT